MELRVNLDSCIGCKICMLICSLKRVGGFNPAYSNIDIRLDIGRKPITYSISKDCKNCDGECKKFCITNSIEVLS